MFLQKKTVYPPLDLRDAALIGKAGKVLALQSKSSRTRAQYHPLLGAQKNTVGTTDKHTRFFSSTFYFDTVASARPHGQCRPDKQPPDPRRDPAFFFAHIKSLLFYPDVVLQYK
jgi:hypothetical protein